MHLPDPLPPVVLSLNVGSSSLKAAVRDPDLRMHVELAVLTGEVGQAGDRWASSGRGVGSVMVVLV
ncbi:MAG: hypothetical protein JWP46_2928 [Modestobacter sp.]|nr:hypothetical protein [Modestobacter sp.]